MPTVDAQIRNDIITRLDVQALRLGLERSLPARILAAQREAVARKATLAEYIMQRDLDYDMLCALVADAADAEDKLMQLEEAQESHDQHIDEVP